MNLVETRNNKTYTTSKIVSEKLSGLKDQHRNVMKTIEKTIANSELFERSRDHATVSFSNVGSHRIVFTETTYKTTQGNTYPMYEMNQAGYHYLVNQLGRYKNAQKVQIEFVDAFEMMGELLKEKDRIIESLIVDGINPVDPKGTVSIVNKKKRLELVKGYYRSTNGKIDKELDEAVKLKQLSLFDVCKITI